MAKTITIQEFNAALQCMLTPTASWKPAMPLGEGESEPIAKVEVAPASDGIFVTLENGERFVLHASKLTAK